MEYAVKYLDEVLHLMDKHWRCLSMQEKQRVEKKLRRLIRKAHASLIGIAKKGGLTEFVDHLVVNKKGSIRHYGIHGVRGHRPDKPGEVQFKDKNGRPVEYEELGEIRVHRRNGKSYKRKARTRRIKKSG